MDTPISLPEKKQTKIIATVGPATESEEMLIKLYQSGVNIIRFNFSHADHARAKILSQRIHDLNQSDKTNLSLLLDTKGPEIRTGERSEPFVVRKQDRFILSVDPHDFEAIDRVYCDYSHLVSDVQVGDTIMIDSWLIPVIVREKHEKHLIVESLHSGTIGSRRHINLPGLPVRLPSITDQDREDIRFAADHDFDFIALSFVRLPEDIAECRAILAERGASHIRIIAKIESQEALDNLMSIVKASDGVMVARGDLGIEVPIERLPSYQRMIIEECVRVGKPVIVATHMLESMIYQPFPTRAEISDIHHSVLQNIDATMLSGETTTGKYPVDAVEYMSRVVRAADIDRPLGHTSPLQSDLSYPTLIKKWLVENAIDMAEDYELRGVILFTRTGRMAQYAAAYRPRVPIIAFSPDTRPVRWMNLLFGIIPYVLEGWSEDYRGNIALSLRGLVALGHASVGDRFVIVSDLQEDGQEIPNLSIRVVV